ncbi:pancreatic triacylglycerol lipase-like [Cotesia typhae]|uniref:pancreatic triacylglycerol lipase-like n=1 Tax=Cotesia typhae TaxID=2053667 RepID=UPI003D69CFA3
MRTLFMFRTLRFYLQCINMANCHSFSYFYFLVLFVFIFNGADAVTQETLDSIFLRLYTGNDASEYIDENLNNLKNLLSQIDDHRNITIYIHGYTESINSTSVKTIVDAYMTRGDHIVMALDWSLIAKESYLGVVASVEAVGTYFARAISNMSCADHSITRRIHIVAHSMGSHVAGAAGRKINPLLPRITGLDPAGPLFNLLRNPLSSSDAEFVDIIHTDAGLYGKTLGSGHVDFWPNRGIRTQPGCPKSAAIYSEDDFCSHHRSWIFYAESLLSEKAFLAVRCSSNGKPSSTDLQIIPMGYATPREARGNYCLITSAQKPYGLQMDGAKEQ